MDSTICSCAPVNNKEANLTSRTSQQYIGKTVGKFWYDNNFLFFQFVVNRKVKEEKNVWKRFDKPASSPSGQTRAAAQWACESWVYGAEWTCWLLGLCVIREYRSGLTRATLAHCTCVSQPTNSWKIKHFWVASAHEKPQIPLVQYLSQFCFDTCAHEPLVCCRLERLVADISFFLRVWWLYPVDPKLRSYEPDDWLTVLFSSETQGAYTSNLSQFDNCMFSQASSTYYACWSFVLYIIVYHIFTMYISCMFL